jgi:hypothetical protein
MNDDETVFPVIDRSAARAAITATIDVDDADRDYAEWRVRAGLPPEA